MKTKHKILGLGVLLVAMLVGVFLAISLLHDDGDVPQKDQRAQYLPGGDFTLKRNQQPFSLSSLRGSPVILYFGYTHCPDICPVGLAVIRDALKSSPTFASVNVVFITVDPLRDTPERLNEYVSFFDPRIIPLSGTEEQIREVAKSYGTYFMRSELGGAEDYTVDHTAYFYLIDQAGNLIRVLDHATDASALAEALKALM